MQIGIIIKFTFDNNTSKKPILSMLLKEIEFDFTIINGHLDKTADANIGTLFVQLLGTDENIKKVISRLNELGIFNGGVIMFDFSRVSWVKVQSKTIETLVMTFESLAAVVIIGICLGLLLYLSSNSNGAFGRIFMQLFQQ